MSQIDILVVWPNRPKQMLQLSNTYQLHRYDLASDAEKEAMLASVGHRIRAVVTSHGGGFSAELLQRLPNVEVVCSSSVGLDTLCVEACQARGIAVTHTPDVLTNDVADMAIMLILATLRRLIPAADWIKNGHWERQGMMPLNTTLTNKTLGLVGMGRIGKAIATRAQAIGLQVCYYARQAKPEMSFPFYGDLQKMAANVDILAPVVPGGAGTKHLIDRAVLAALKPTSYVINISRGSVIDETALVECLQQGNIAGAGLDVFDDEPHVPSPLLAMDNVVLQPHCASGTVETRDAMAQLVVDNLAAHFAGKPLLTPAPQQ